MSAEEAKGAADATKATPEAPKEPKTATRTKRLDVRMTSDEDALTRRCALHFNDGKPDAEVSIFIRNLVILYAIDHGLPLHEGDVAGGVGENEDARKLAVKRGKVDEGVARLGARKGAK